MSIFPEPWRPEKHADAIAALPDRYPAPGVGPPPIRATRKAADWTRGIYRAAAYLAGRASDPTNEAQLAALLERTLAAGPDFAKVRSKASFTAVAITAYSKGAAAEIMRQARAIERESYASRAKGQHGGALGRMAMQLLEWFAYGLWPRARYGMTPSLAHIAAAARMSKATVVEAMKRLEAFGFLTIQRRRKRVPTPLGVKVVQDCNGYVLGLAKGLGALALAALGREPQVEGDKPARSEFSRPPAIRNESYSLREQRQNWLAAQDYEPLLE